MSVVLGFVFLLAWFLGMVQLGGMGYRLVCRAWRFLRVGAHAPQPRPEGEPVEPGRGDFYGR